MIPPNHGSHEAKLFYSREKSAVLQGPTAGGATGVKPRMFFYPQTPTTNPQTWFHNQEL